jgi:hypothetical protein
MNGVLQLRICGVGVRGPGITDWPAARSILAGQAPYRFEPMLKAMPDLLPAAERRRSSDSVRLAIEVAQQAVRDAGIDPVGLASVFAASDSDGRIIHDICEALAQPERHVSPTAFHNSVHNAPAGYWCIATGCHAASTSISAYDLTFAAGLLEAAAQVTADERPVLLVACDLPLPPPLHELRPIAQPFAAAFILAPLAQRPDLPAWALTLAPPQASPADATDVPECLRSNPAARSWPLLASFARGPEGAPEIRFAYFDDQMVVLRRAP